MRIIGVANQKGGVGKTTTAHNLAVGLAKQRHKVLLIDLDPQSNLTDSCGVKLDKDELSTMDVLNGTPAETAFKNIMPGLDLLPSHLSLAGADSFFAGAIRREDKLRDALEPIVKAQAYAVAIMDCPPNLGLIAQNAFRAMDRLLIPVQCEYHSLEGLRLLHECLAAWKRARLLSSDFAILGILPTFFDRRKKLCRDVLGLLQQEYGEMLLESIIRDNVHLAEAPSSGLDIFNHNASCHGAYDYEALSQEIARKLKMKMKRSEANDQRQKNK